MSLKRYKTFVRAAFQAARDELDRGVEQTLAANAAAGRLASSATVEQLARIFSGFAIDAVDRCRSAAGRSLPRQAHLRAVLPSEVDRLGRIVTDALDHLGHFDHVQEAVRALMAEQTERVLRDRAPPPSEPRADLNPSRPRLSPALGWFIAIFAASLMAAWLAFRLVWTG